mmetsp:Transcript_57604/g.166765  ORF Transcript_57604/g.166765 Transcript_57604/m.166765 type:complete len:161 (-) Transcript_57604:172-654(-)
MGNNPCCQHKDDSPVVTAVAISALSTDAAAAPESKVPEPPEVAAPGASAKVDGAVNPKSDMTVAPVVANATEPSMTLTFQTPEGEEKSFAFTRRPVGLDFCRSVPTKVKRAHPNGAAAEFGIEENWVLAKVNDESVLEKSSLEVHSVLKRFIVDLPARAS